MKKNKYQSDIVETKLLILKVKFITITKKNKKI